MEVVTAVMQLKNISFMETTQSINQNISAPCEPVWRKDLIVFSVLVILEILWNIIILVAIYISRTKLKQNYVYTFVASMIVANIVLGFVMVLTLLGYLYWFERPLNPLFNASTSNAQHIFNHSDYEHLGIMNWWAFRKTLMVGLFLVMNGNVVCLIRGITETAYIVGRVGRTSVSLRIRILLAPNAASSDTTEGKKSSFVRQKEAILTIALSWILPLIYTMIVFGWNCLDYCTCLPAYYNKKHFCSTVSNPYRCSNIWVPMRKGHLLLAVALWILQFIAIAVMLTFAIKTYYQTAIKPSAFPTKKVSIEEVKEDRALNDEEVNTRKLKSLTNASQRHSLKQASKLSLHPTIKLLIALSVLYTVCTAPMMTCFAVDSLVASGNVISDFAVTVSSAIVFLYCFAGPGFMIAYMPGLRAALINMLLKCDCTRTNVSATMSRIAMKNKKSNKV